MKPMGEINSASAAIIPTRESERQLHKITKRHGGPSMSDVQDELARYILCHEKAGRKLDTEGQALRFDDRINVLIRKLDGIWHILRVWRREGKEIFRPVFSWQVVMRGWRTFLARVLTGWQYRALPAGYGQTHTAG
jgi:hypothetical protein